VYTGFVQRGLPLSSPKNVAAPLYDGRFTEHVQGKSLASDAKICGFPAEASVFLTKTAFTLVHSRRAPRKAGFVASAATNTTVAATDITAALVNTTVAFANIAVPCCCCVTHKNPLTPCLWQAPASVQKTKRKTRPAIRQSARWRVEGGGIAVPPVNTKVAHKNSTVVTTNITVVSKDHSGNRHGYYGSFIGTFR